MSGHAGGGGLGFNTSFTDVNTGLFGNDSAGSGTEVRGESGNITKREQLQIDEEGILRLITNALSGEGGLADIFGAEKSSGIFNSSVAKQASGDLLAKISGELAKLTGVKTLVETRDLSTESVKQQNQESEGLLDNIGGKLFGGLF